MARNQYQIRSPFLSIFLWFFIIFLLSIGGLFLLDFVGIYSFQPDLGPYMRLIGLNSYKHNFSDNDPFLLEKERIEKRELSVFLQQQELAKSEVDLARRQLELEQLANELSEQQKTQKEREEQFIKQTERYTNEKKNLTQNAKYFLAMPPEAAVERLKDLDDIILISHLRMAEEIAKEKNENSMVPVWLSMLPADQASRIIKKMQLPTTP